ncbi:hypothetical protein NFI96_027837 [Prochilodus magdalenae]|nr:hypothetical protein NFI96_027837 [Prochilodus magdalenae]
MILCDSVCVPVSLCRDVFSVTLPQSVEAVNRLCVLINCSFTIYNQYDEDLQNNPKGIWRKDGTEEDKTVFDSTTPESNKIKGRITGDLRMKDCTTIFNRTNNDHNRTYYFRIEAGPELKYTFATPSVSITVKDSPPKPTLSLFRDQTEVEDRRVLEGSSVSLLCSALSLCPTQPPTLIWSPLPTNINQQQIQSTSFISSRLHHGLRFYCTATYQLEDKDPKTAQSSLVLRVLYPPKNTSVSVSPSGPVVLGSSVSLNCSSDGNPAVNYTCSSEGVIQCVCEVHGNSVYKLEWHLSGQPVPPSVNPSTREESVGSIGLRSVLSMHYSLTDMHSLQCVSTNELGSTTKLIYSVATGHSSECKPTIVPDVILAVLLLLCAVIIGFLLYKLRQLSTKTKALKVEGDTYTSLQLSAQSSDYETLQPNRVSMCRDVFSVTLPQSVEAVNGLCVLINCSFTIENQFDEDLQVNPKAIWRKDGIEEDKTVFDSKTPESNKIKGRITGDLRMKDCTTIFNNVNKNDTGTYYFKIVAGIVQDLKYVYATASVSLHVRDPPKNTAVSVSPSGPVMLGSSVTLSCSSDGNPAVNYTWYRQNGEQIGTGASLTIKLDYTHSGLYCRAQNQHGAQNSSVKLDIQYQNRTGETPSLQDRERNINMQKVSMCRDVFSVTLPQSVEAVNGLCVLINCSFTIEDKFDEDLQVNPKAIWRKDGIEEDKTVFDSKTPESNKIKGRITGDLQKKDCTTIFNNVNKNDTGTYYFRIVAGIVQDLKYVYTTASVSLHVRDSPPKPTLSLNRDQTEVEDRKVLEGSSVSLLCSALSPCPTQPPTLTWSPLPTNINQQQIQSTSFISSQLNFIATRLHHGLRFNCTATYQLENKVAKTAQRSLILRVLYPPKNTSVSVSPSGPVMLGNSVTLSCSSEGNPAVNYTWYRQNGEQIGTGPSLTIKTDDTHSGLYCRAQNQHGAQTSVKLDIQ